MYAFAERSFWFTTVEARPVFGSRPRLRRYNAPNPSTAAWRTTPIIKSRNVPIRRIAQRYVLRPVIFRARALRVVLDLRAPGRQIDSIAPTTPQAQFRPSLLQVPSPLPPQITIFRYKLCGTLILIEANPPVDFHS